MSDSDRVTIGPIMRAREPVKREKQREAEAEAEARKGRATPYWIFFIFN